VNRIISAAVCTVVATLVLAAPSAHAQTDAAGLYVALGDSFSAGPLIPAQVGNPSGCLRSDHNYPSLVRRALGITNYIDETCSAATTEHMTAAQSVPLGVHEPQFNALRADATLVTVGIGGNDIGLVGAALRCVGLGLTAPTGTACRSSFNRGGQDQLGAAIEATAPKIAGVLQGIRTRAPAAQIVLVGYPDMTPRDGSNCYPLVPLSSDDLRYFDELLVKTNAMLAEQAAANDAEYADTFTDSIGHDVCKLPPNRWFEGVVPTAPAFPVHPNALGMQSMARSVLRVLGQPRPPAVLSDLKRTRRSYRSGRAVRITYDLSRAASVTFMVRRAVSGRRQGGRCAPLRRSNRRARPCPRYSGVIGQFTDARPAGSNSQAISPRTIGHKVGLYRLTATPVSATGEAPAAARTLQFRIKP